MRHCKDKATHMKALKRDHDILKEELKIIKNKFEYLEDDHNALLNKVPDKTESEHEFFFQNVIITGLERTNGECFKLQLLKNSQTLLLQA